MNPAPLANRFPPKTETYAEFLHFVHISLFYTGEQEILSTKIFLWYVVGETFIETKFQYNRKISHGNCD